MSDYLYDLDGDVIAFRRSWDDEHVFDTSGRWIGWIPWDGTDVVDERGHYLASIVGDRLVRRNDCGNRRCAQAVEHPDRAEPSGRPTRPLEFPNRFAYDDVEQLHRAG
ncbi:MULTISPECIES: 4-fold beta flower protein [unclassified Aeromicrobium]|uniref:4-fold beta flower protein n=1 Tax=unclassified Aeromicrobium TaxID=2633570 RepID=UPI0020981371|nr:MULTISPECIES: hypothetical protein [unclassified Aeromicrobium]MCO7237777.1 hypothetical protein [Aeromicrobium sp. CnD17-E]MDR6117739.1 hypothetical protein [Aeromicrobium sp. SORGH_AS_0981]